MGQPRIGVVTVNYRNADLTLRCVEHVLGSEWPSSALEVVVVDNDPDSGLRTAVASRGLAAMVLDTGRNLGFAEACNLGIAKVSACDYVALVNNDARPEPGWLAPLVDAFDAESVGAATPLVLLEGSFVTVTIASAPQYAPGDPRPLGVQMSGLRVAGADLLDRVQLGSGCWGWEMDPQLGRFVWSSDEASVHVPFDGDRARVEVRLSSCLGPTTVEVAAGGEAAGFEVDAEPQWFPVPGAQATPLVNNTGTILRPDGSVADRGYLEPLGQGHLQPSDPFGWSAAAVLLSSSYLRDVGHFDARYFLYYEDADLAWRGRLRRWDYRFVPESRVWHEHSATVGGGSELTRHLHARNRLVTIARNAPRKVVVRELWSASAQVAATARRDVLAPVLRRRGPRTHHVRRDARVLLAAGAMLPATLLDRSRRRGDLRRAAAVVEQWAGRPRDDRLDSPSVQTGR